MTALPARGRGRQGCPGWGGRLGRGGDGRGGQAAGGAGALSRPNATARRPPPPPPQPRARRPGLSGRRPQGAGLGPRTRSGGGAGLGGPARGRGLHGRLLAPRCSSGLAGSASCPSPRPRVRRRPAASGPGRSGRRRPSTLRAQHAGHRDELRGPEPEGLRDPHPRPHFTDAATEAREGPEPADKGGLDNLAASPPGPGSGEERRDAEGDESSFPPPRGSVAGTSALLRDRRRQTPCSSLSAAPARGAARRPGAFPPASRSAPRRPGSGAPRPAPPPPPASRRNKSESSAERQQASREEGRRAGRGALRDPGTRATSASGDRARAAGARG